MIPLPIKKEDFLQLGNITKIHSYKGEVIFLAAGEPKIEIEKQESVFVEINGQLVPFFIESCRQFGNDAAIIKFSDVNTEENARKFIGCGVFFPLCLLPREKSSRLSPVDIRGYKVIDDTYGEIGKITNVLDMPQQRILEISNGSKEILIPANEETVYKIDKKSKTVFIDAPNGLIDIYIK